MVTLPHVSAVEPELKNGWLTIWFDQVDNRNALSEALVKDLVAVLLAVRETREVRGITLRGRGGIFCAGGDLKSFNSSQSGGISQEKVAEGSIAAAGIFDLVNAMPQVTIALIEGAAMAGGFGMACCCDVVLSTNEAKFAMTETAIGLTPAQISPFVIQRLGYATARRLMLTAARFDGEQSQALGFADFTSSDVAELEAYEMQVRKQVLRCAPGAVASIKGLILALPALSREEGIKAAATSFAAQFVSEEAREGVASFVEKRKPSWSVEP